MEDVHEKRCRQPTITCAYSIGTTATVLRTFIWDVAL